jgi:hypothetical protein
MLHIQITLCLPDIDRHHRVLAGTNHRLLVTYCSLVGLSENAPRNFRHTWFFSHSYWLLSISPNSHQFLIWISEDNLEQKPKVSEVCLWVALPVPPPFSILGVSLSYSVPSSFPVSHQNPLCKGLMSVTYTLVRLCFHLKHLGSTKSSLCVPQGPFECCDERKKQGSMWLWIILPR